MNMDDIAIRDMFAAAALQGVLAAKQAGYDESTTAYCAFDYAEAMMKERNKRDSKNAESAHAVNVAEHGV